MINNAVKNLYILETSLNTLHNYLDSSTKLFSDLCVAKILHTSAKSFFSLFLYPTENTIYRSQCGDRIVSKQDAFFDSYERFHDL